MKSYTTEAKAFRRQTYLAREAGIYSGVRRIGNRWGLIHDPDLTHDRLDPKLQDAEMDYVTEDGQPDRLVYEDPL